MKNLQTYLVPAIAVIVAVCATALVMPQCQSPNVVTQVVERRIEIPGDTIVAPAQTIYKTRVQYQTDPNNLDTIAALRAQVEQAQSALNAYAAVSVQATVVLPRNAHLIRGCDTTLSAWDDTLDIQAQPYPVNSITASPRAAVIVLPADTLTASECLAPGAPWYVEYGLEALKIIAGVAVGYLSK